ncbi:MAG: hypothetical protein KKB91_12385 [Proteobacteria bacterium]|jgi:hypothetical protein|nr:hypothetical protein [Desulfocapsa sp.]MBU3945209.1 hypothetical protein [Pseudomonadota bacterium]MCG2744466.1 hypothetical protein [Desulfobacteraceae bacterium]MBU3982440.1 hypothetical protein [Pseudomonadota bacterium]MBU4028669.1 hypothetical protein [Pseudomonadota bacterium]
MVKKIVLVALVLVIALGGWLAYYFSDKEVIKRQLTDLAVELGKEGQESPIQMALKMRKVKNMLGKSCLVTIPERTYHEALEQDLIIHYLIYHRNRYSLLAIAFEDVIVNIPAKGQAEVQNTVRLRRQNTTQTAPIEEIHKVEMSLVKADQKWLFDKVILPKALIE